MFRTRTLTLLKQLVTIQFAYFLFLFLTLSTENMCSNQERMERIAFMWHVTLNRRAAINYFTD